jgi:hypothetical protein
VAVDLVEKLLELPVQEAAPVSAPIPARDRYPLRVFGNDAPPKGWFYTGPDPFGDFIRSQRGGDKAQLNNESDRKRYIDFFTRQGYILVFKESPGLKIHSQVNLFIPQDGVKALEQTMGLTPETQVEFRNDQAPASEIIYGQPNRANQQPDKTSQSQHGQQNQGQSAAPQQLLKATFGGIYGPQGHFETGKDVNIAAMKKLLADGYAFVIRYGNGGYNVVTPKAHKFSRSEIREIESKMGINRATKVQWFQNSVSANAATPTTAQVAIYGEQPTKTPPPAGLATPPPSF